MTLHGNLLLTGAAGFIGRQFARKASDLGYSLISVDHPEHFQSRQEITGVDFGTIVDREKLFSWLEESSKNSKFKIGGIVHLGACTDTTQMDESFLNRVNYEYSQQIWNWATRYRVPLVYASSAATYGAGEYGYSDDEGLISNLKPLNPYGESKRRFDVWALEQERLGQTPPSWCGFKFFNVYGWGERHKGKMASVVLQAFDQIQKDGQVKLFKSHRPDIADGDQKRDFVYVDDVVNVLLFALDKPIPRGVFNLGSGKARSFLDLTRAVFTALEKKENIQFVDTPESLRAQYQYFTEAKMHKLQHMGFSQPFTSLEEGVTAYVQRLSQSAGKTTR